MSASKLVLAEALALAEGLLRWGSLVLAGVLVRLVVLRVVVVYRVLLLVVLVENDEVLGALPMAAASAIAHEAGTHLVRLLAHGRPAQPAAGASGIH